MAKSVDSLTPSSSCPELVVPISSFANRVRIQAIVNSPDLGRNYVGQVITVCGWSRSVRKQGGGEFCFVSLNDGSTVGNLQVLVHNNMDGYNKILKAGVGCSFKFTGEIVASPAAEQAVEMKLNDPVGHSLIMYGGANQSVYPLSKKKHGREFLREIAHLRPRTFLIGAVTRVRSQLAMATHRFFQDKGFLYIHTPIITSADCEGAGELFQVTTLMKDNVEHIPVVPGKEKLVDYKKEFFGKPTFLTVSGQLAVENFCCALSDVYTFGPTFRAENSHTSRHLGEFWMIEPEMAFADINDNMDCAEAYLKYCVEWALKNCASDIKWFGENVEENLVQRLENILAEPFIRITYTEAIDVLKESSQQFEQQPEWGIDMGAEHERYLTEAVYKKPVIVYNYPKAFKAFYMRQNDDGKTVAAMDVLVPKIGEVIGGSQREERLEYLDNMIKEKGLDPKPYWWYRELREYGSIPHAGYGLGFERLIMLVTGMDNIRDVIPFPRYPGHAEF